MKLLKVILIFSGIFFYSNIGDDIKVYVSEKGAKYHTKDCEFLLKPYSETTMKKAKAKGLIECAECITKPALKKSEANKSNKSATSKKRVVKYCTSIKKNGERCRKKTRNSSGRCKLHR